tara:strand:- start:119 stop:1090 length:972 start_codon:yes stop_codon:yes gene_type:complete
MAFLNNSGDIILDAVLTDLGRKRLSQGDGSFEISQFALGDDEIDYSQYNLTTGSAYQDLDILQTPILEAITDNIASMKSKLVTYSDTSLLYLPIEKLQTSDANGAGFNTSSIGTFVALVNADGDFGTNVGTTYGFSTRSPAKNLLAGNFLARSTGDRTKNSITIHQGLNTTQVSFTENLSGDLTETDYFVFLDNRLGTLIKPNGDTLQPAFIDDDNIATYVISQGNAVNAENFVTIRDPETNDTSSPSSIDGPYNRQALRFSVFASDNLAFSDFLFTKFGNTTDTTDGSYTSVFSIDSEVRVVGAKTGYSLSIPIRFVKIKTF